MTTKSTKIALITGAAQRLGRAMAERLHQAGWHIIIHYHQSAEAAETLVAKVNQARPDSALCLTADLTDHASLANLVKQAASHWGQLDLLINNASVFFKTAATDASLTDWDNLIDCNLRAPYFLTQAAIPHLKQSDAGQVINITDIHGSRPLRDYSIYSISKAGLVMMTRALARELGPEIRVNAIAPGALMWPEGDNALSSAEQQALLRKIPLGRSGSADDIAAAVLSLTEQHYLNGTTLTLDGGRSCY